MCPYLVCISLESRSSHTNAYPSVVSMHSGASKLYPFRKIFLTTAKSHRRKQEAPIKAILHLVDQEWNLSPALTEFWGGLAAPTQGFPRIRRPSMCEFQWRRFGTIHSTDQMTSSQGATYARLSQRDLSETSVACGGT